MTEYTAHSTHPGSDSIARAYRIREFLHVSNFEGGKYASTAMKPDAARTFARGILALADEIDGGEVAEAYAHGGGHWFFSATDSIELVDEPDSSPADTTPSPFTRCVEEAKALLAGTAHTGDHVIRLAVELADRT